MDQRILALAYLANMAAKNDSPDSITTDRPNEMRGIQALIKEQMTDETLEDLHHDHMNGYTSITAHGVTYRLDWNTNLITES